MTASGTSSGDLLLRNDLDSNFSYTDSGEVVDIQDTSRLKRFSNQVQYSGQYIIFYSCLLLQQIFMFIYAAVLTKAFSETLIQLPLWYIILDMSVLALMVVEIALRILASDTRFFRKKTNIQDFVLVVLCVGSQPLYFFHDRRFVISHILMFARYLSQVIRISMIVRFQIQRRSIANIGATEILLHNEGYTHDNTSQIDLTNEVHTSYEESMISSLDRQFSDMIPLPPSQNPLPLGFDLSDEEEAPFSAFSCDERIASGIASLHVSHQNQAYSIPNVTNLPV